MLTIIVLLFLNGIFNLAALHWPALLGVLICGGLLAAFLYLYWGWMELRKIQWGS